MGKVYEWRVQLCIKTLCQDVALHRIAVREPVQSLQPPKPANSKPERPRSMSRKTQTLLMSRTPSGCVGMFWLRRIRGTKQGHPHFWAETAQPNTFLGPQLVFSVGPVPPFGWLFEGMPRTTAVAGARRGGPRGLPAAGPRGLAEALGLRGRATQR